ncbi:MAG: nicotinate (nicotinamide) nucleotide adenylyltransferase [Ruminococcaceae bacterium]|nr:nicotinate (nicotinamide) nucleotide adenylyltransferase [Oscillospiraceae bacterium]
MKIGIFGGTFDPPHLGHISVCKAFLNTIELDALYVMPAYIPPHKTVISGINADKRFKMSEIAFSSLSNKIIVSDIEFKREGKSYTAHTLKYFKENFKDIEIYFLCGTDMILTMDMWYCPEYIFENAKIVYARRENDSDITQSIDLKCKKYKEKYNAEIIYLTTDVKEMSSSEIRKAISCGNDLSKYLSKEIIDFIKENKMYVD